MSDEWLNLCKLIEQKINIRPEITSKQCFDQLLFFSLLFPNTNVILNEEHVNWDTIGFMWKYSNGTYKMNYHNQEEFMNSIKENKKRFTIIFLILSYPKMCHANIIVYDSFSNVACRYDPLGYSSLEYLPLFNYQGLNQELNNFFVNHGIIYISPYYYCPTHSIQALQEIESDHIIGYCQPWTLWYAYMWVKHPDLTPSELHSKIKNKIEFNKNTLSGFILELDYFLLYNKYDDFELFIQNYT